MHLQKILIMAGPWTQNDPFWQNVLLSVWSASSSSEWTTDQVRRTFVEFFVESKGHVYQPSSACAPLNGPTLLVTNAGRNQFKPNFLGQVDPHSPQAQLQRACNSQKCTSTHTPDIKHEVTLLYSISEANKKRAGTYSLHLSGLGLALEPVVPCCLWKPGAENAVRTHLKKIIPFSIERPLFGSCMGRKGDSVVMWLWISLLLSCILRKVSQGRCDCLPHHLLLHQVAIVWYGSHG
jgi:hypothetical protein